MRPDRRNDLWGCGRVAPVRLVARPFLAPNSRPLRIAASKWTGLPECMGAGAAQCGKLWVRLELAAVYEKGVPVRIREICGHAESCSVSAPSPFPQHHARRMASTPAGAAVFSPAPSRAKGPVPLFAARPSGGEHHGLQAPPLLQIQQHRPHGIF